MMVLAAVLEAAAALVAKEPTEHQVKVTRVGTTQMDLLAVVAAAVLEQLAQTVEITVVRLVMV